MHLQTLFLRNFRNFEEAHISFCPQLNLIEGGNAQGKTNLLEAIYLLSTGRSFRTAHLGELIRQGASFFYLEAAFMKDGISQTVKIAFDGVARKLEYNQTAYSSFITLLGLLPTVLYAPEDIALVIGGPLERRRLLDIHLAHCDPLYIHHLQRYTQAMKQRNHLLRMQSEAGIETWEEIMSLSSFYLLQKRKEAALALEPPAQAAMQKLSCGSDHLEIRYHSTLSLETSFMDQFRKQRRREMHFKCTLIGPHRDDLIFSLNGKLAKSFSSEGQKRCLIAALRLAEWQRLRALIEEPPLLSIDDFGVHLDEARYHAFRDLLYGQSQVFLTSPAFLDNYPSFLQKQTLAIKEGRVKEEEKLA